MIPTIFREYAPTVWLAIVLSMTGQYLCYGFVTLDWTIDPTLWTQDRRMITLCWVAFSAFLAALIKSVAEDME